MPQSQTAKMTNSRERRRRQEAEELDVAEVSQDLMEYFREYARENPEKAALWCLGIGFVLGWKLKPW